jgi:two-component system invasion response regulator UvrY
MASSPSARLEPEDTVGVMIVDDQPPFRRAARAVIGATAGFVPLGDAASGYEALKRADQLEPDLVLMDVHMPGIDGIEAARQLTEAHPGCVVVLVSLDELDDPATTVASCGAADYLRKQDLKPDVLRGLWAAHGGRP